MRLDRRQTIVAAGVVGALVLAAGVLWWTNRAHEAERSSPAWLDPQQPPDVIPALTGPTPLESWAANRCRPMTACCTGATAGTRVRRLYPDTLQSSPHSFIRASVNLSGEL